jgi:tRNA pseudouridine38-40 synthase
VIYHYKLIVQYKGTNYSGWQIQLGTKEVTVQGELNRALSVVSKSEEVRSLGAGRTDAGVHALGQVVKVSIPLSIAPENFLKALNTNLPDDIRVIQVEVSDEAFMPTIHAKSKEYHYRFTSQRGFTAFQNDFIVNYSFELDLAKMREACKLLVGEHDFTNFYTEGTEVSSTVRKIFSCDIIEIAQGEWEMLPSHYVFRITGNGFLKQMVRLLMGAVWNVGRGKITLEELRSALGPTKVQRLGAVAPPNGLYMIRVNY